MSKNTEDLRNLVYSIIDTVALVRDEVVVRTELSDSVYMAMCTEFNKHVPCFWILTLFLQSIQLSP